MTALLDLLAAVEQLQIEMNEDSQIVRIELKFNAGTAEMIVNFRSEQAAQSAKAILSHEQGPGVYIVKVFSPEFAQLTIQF